MNDYTAGSLAELFRRAERDVMAQQQWPQQWPTVQSSPYTLQPSWDTEGWPAPTLSVTVCKRPNVEPIWSDVDGKFHVVPGGMYVHLTVPIEGKAWGIHTPLKVTHVMRTKEDAEETANLIFQGLSTVPSLPLKKTVERLRSLVEMCRKEGLADLATAVETRLPAMALAAADEKDDETPVKFGSGATLHLYPQHMISSDYTGFVGGTLASLSPANP